jgi:hypothetical protein
MLNKNFKNQTSSELITTQIQTFLRGNRLSTSLILPPNEVFCPDCAVRMHLYNYTGIEQYFGISHLHDQGQRARFTTIAKNNIDIWFRQVAYNIRRGFTLTKRLSTA